MQLNLAKMLSIVLAKMLVQTPGHMQLYRWLICVTCVRCWKELCGHASVEGVWQDSWRALEELVGSGQIHSVGV